MGAYFPPRTRDLLGHPGPTPNPRGTAASSTAVLSQNPGCDGSTLPPTAPLMDCAPELRSPRGGGRGCPTYTAPLLPAHQASARLLRSGRLRGHCRAVTPLAKSHLMQQVSRQLARCTGFLRGTNLAKAEIGSNLIICSSHTVRDTLTYSKTPWAVQRMNKHDSLPLWHPGHEE